MRDMQFRDNGAGRSVLLVEDNTDLRDVLGSLLESVGCHTVLASTAQDAVRALQGQQFDVVVSDVRFPGGGVEHLAEELLKLASRPALVVMTGDVSSIADTASDYIATATFIEKPFNLSCLLASVDRAAGAAQVAVA